MPGKTINLDAIQGLSGPEIPLLQAKYGKNIFQADPSHRYIYIVWNIVKEPMFILLVTGCSLYFILDKISEGIMMAVAMSIVAAISLYQEVKSSHALQALKQYTEPKVTVIRDGKEIVIKAEELVPGDCILLEEGMNIPADAIILHSNDLTVNESIITGESIPADKEPTEGSNILYQGTTINSGKCIARVSATGNRTVLGKMGIAIGAYRSSKTVLQMQISGFVRRLALFGLIGFFIIFFVNYLHYHEWITSLLFALTLAMSAVPEEIPVAFSSFMALGAYRMSKLGIISRQPQIVENLGAVTVICLDKTGTITENKMQVKMIYDYESDKMISLDDGASIIPESVLRYGMLASETNPFDAMEKGIWEAWNKYAGNKEPVPKMIHEYPLQGKPPMMTHVYKANNMILVAAKGAAEKVMDVCRVSDSGKEKLNGHIKLLSSKGYRVIAVASATQQTPELPAAQENFNWQFEGLLALYDPPKKIVPSVIRSFYDAHIEVKLVTGDHPGTACAIAAQVGISNTQEFITGDEVMSMNKTELQEVAKTKVIFARMFPDAKVKLIEALKANGEIVAMTGDGVNDGPALKLAHIGIAMGEMGTEIAKQASDLVLTDDNLERMVTAIREGRKIYYNLKKAVRYIISIHIPIILVASLPVVLGWTYPNIFTPIHVIFLELIMGPTCSIFFEREPVEKNIMQMPPRKRSAGLFTRTELLTSVTQGLIISLAVLILYYYFMQQGFSIGQTRNIVFTSLILSNVFLTFANRSFSKTIYFTSRYKNSLVPFVLIFPAFFLSVLYFIPFVRNLFQLETMSVGQFFVCLVMALAAVMWFEMYKAIRAKRPG